jgi:hypothetical protein
MKSTGLVLLLGLAAGLAAHAGWYGFRRPAPATAPGAALAWMKSDLNLSAQQFEKIKAIHDQSGPQLRQLAAQAAHMRAELDAFEQLRRTDGRVDFLEFADFIQQRRAVDRACVETTRRLIAATAGEMTPEQRQRYLALLNPAAAHPVN